MARAANAGRRGEDDMLPGIIGVIVAIVAVMMAGNRRRLARRLQARDR